MAPPTYSAGAIFLRLGQDRGCLILGIAKSRFAMEPLEISTFPSTSIAKIRPQPAHFVAIHRGPRRRRWDSQTVFQAIVLPDGGHL